jgi:hypothetical protein
VHLDVIYDKYQLNAVGLIAKSKTHLLAFGLVPIQVGVALIRPYRIEFTSVA